MGDPAGIGPEVVEGALRQWLVTSSPFHVELIGPSGIADVIAKSMGDSRVTARVLAPFEGSVGGASAESGRASLAALNEAIVAAQKGEVQGIVTAPISKQALHLAGSKDVGHTDILARALGIGPVAMAFYAPQLRVVLATVHQPLRQAIASLSATRIVEVARLLSDNLQTDLGIAEPRLALAGLNPHAGEGGIMGDEEMTVLAPAVREARALGITISDPIAPDTVFRRAVDGEFDGVIALYHDQGLIPVKLLAFGDAVNVTLGLSIPRTSPDHGTAYDIVGKNCARSEGLFQALCVCCELIQHRKVHL